MASSISSVTQAPAVPSPAASKQKPAQSAQPPAASSDSVQLSPAAQARIAALQEARETSAQTAKEAAGGDPQAQRLSAREAAAKTVRK